MRKDGRNFFDMREVVITPYNMSYAEGSAEIQMGKTKVICTASVEDHLPKWMGSSGQGWITAEYNMLPRSTSTRVRRERVASSGRTLEISRLIGRTLRASCDLSLLKSKQIIVDCDVVQADGGTRVASITGGYVALALALKNLRAHNILSQDPSLFFVCAVSAVLIKDQMMVDPTAQEDQSCSSDMNFVFSNQGSLIEVQGTAEKEPFQKDQLVQMIEETQKVAQNLFQIQSQVLNLS